MNSTPIPDDSLSTEAHLWPTDSLANTGHGSNPRKADMRGISKRKNKNGSYGYRAQVRLNDGLPPQSKTFPTLLEARAWKTQEEAKRRQGMYLPSMTSKHKRLGELITRYIEQVLPSKPKNASNTRQHLCWWKEQLGDLPLSRLTSDVIATTRNKLLGVITRRGTKLSSKTANRYLASLSVCLFLRETKTGVPRSVPLSNEAKSIIEEMAPPGQRHGLVFKGRRFGGKPSIRKPFYTALSIAGIEDLHIHDFRHLFCTTAARAGASILQIKSITGHSTQW